MEVIGETKGFDIGVYLDGRETSSNIRASAHAGQILRPNLVRQAAEVRSPGILCCRVPEDPGAVGAEGLGLQWGEAA